MAYASLAELRAELKLSAGETVDDTLLTNYLARAQAFVESAECCNRVFEAGADSTRYFDVGRDTDGTTLRLDYDLAATPTTVTNGNGEVIASTAYVLEPRNVTPYYAIRLKATSGYVWSYGDDPDNPIVIVGKWAYSTSAPTRIKTATLLLAKWMYQQRANQSADADRTIVSGDGMIILPSALPKVFWDMVSGYKRR